MHGTTMKMMCKFMTLWGKTGLGARKIKEQGMND